MRLYPKRFISVTATLFGVILLACSNQVEPVPAPAAPPPASAPTATAVPEPTATPSPTSAPVAPAVATTTSVPPTATSTPEPSTPTSVPTQAEVPTPTSTSVPPTATPEPMPESLEITSIIEQFTLENLTVKLGTTITWLNEDRPSHTTTSGTPPNRFTNLWDSGNLDQTQSFSFTFDRAGEFAYFCTIHPWMIGMITVTDN